MKVSYDNDCNTKDIPKKAGYLNSKYVSSQNFMKLRIILLHDSYKNCRNQFLQKNIKDWLELISAPTISPRSI